MLAPVGGQRVDPGRVNARPQPLHPVLRALGLPDVDRMLAIETASYPFPWSRAILSDCIRVGYSCTGLQLGEELAGYIILNWAAGECHLLNLCVHPDWQGEGYGSILLEHGIGLARHVGCTAMFLEVRASNRDAERLYARRGFSVIGTRKDYYQSENGREDATVMQLGLGEQP